MRTIRVLFLTLSISMSLLVMPASALAASTKQCSNDSSFLLGLPTWYKYLTVGQVTQNDKNGKPVVVDECGVILPVKNGETDWGQAIGRVGLALTEILLRLGAMVAVGFIIYGGYRYILSQGEPDAIKKAQGTIVNSVIGLVITIFATAIVNLIGGVILK